MKNFVLMIKGLCLGLGFVLALVGAQTVAASDLPRAPGSPIAGIAFDDQPLVLPVQRNFQMAMLTASSELGRSCGRLESYGWRLNRQEQGRVNQIFNNTIDRVRAQGFEVKAQKTKAVSSDVTLFTADNADKHLLFLWSAGDVGLVLVLCETSSPLSATPLSRNDARSMYSPYPMPQTIAPPAPLSSPGAVRNGYEPLQLTRTGKPRYDDFTPIGNWVGSYSCAQGTTGATLEITSLKGGHFEGIFHFYPIAKNPYVPQGKYAVFGEYDLESQRILVNPGKWIEHPKGYYSTIMIGGFDPVAQSFSAFFQGITGCTSFEAHYEAPKEEEPPKIVKKKPQKKSNKGSSKKKVVKKNTEPVAVENTASVTPLPPLPPVTEGSKALDGMSVK